MSMYRPPPPGGSFLKRGGSSPNLKEAPPTMNTTKQRPTSPSAGAKQPPVTTPPAKYVESSVAKRGGSTANLRPRAGDAPSSISTSSSSGAFSSSSSTSASDLKKPQPPSLAATKGSLLSKSTPGLPLKGLSTAPKSPVTPSKSGPSSQPASLSKSAPSTSSGKTPPPPVSHSKSMATLPSASASKQSPHTSQTTKQPPSSFSTPKLRPITSNFQPLTLSDPTTKDKTLPNGRPLTTSFKQANSSFDGPAKASLPQRPFTARFQPINPPASSTSTAASIVDSRLPRAPNARPPSTSTLSVLTLASTRDETLPPLPLKPSKAEPLPPLPAKPPHLSSPSNSSYRTSTAVDPELLKRPGGSASGYKPAPPPALPPKSGSSLTPKLPPKQFDPRATTSLPNLLAASQSVAERQMPVDSERLAAVCRQLDSQDLSLQHLNLCGWRLQTKDLQKLCGSLSKYKPLISLDLSDMGLASAETDIHILCAALQNLEIKTLSLRYCEIGANSLNALKSLTKDHYYLCNLEILESPSIDPKLFSIISQIEIHITENRRLDLFRAGGMTNVDISYRELAVIPLQVIYWNKVTTLNVSHNHLSALPKELGDLTSLEHLNASWNKLSELPPEVSKLTNLKSVDVSHNMINDIPETIRWLPSIIEINFEYNNIKILPVFLGSMSQLRGIKVSHNPLYSIPTEVLIRGDSFLLNYIRALSQGSTNCYRIKLMLVGDGNVGKTTLLAALVEQKAKFATANAAYFKTTEAALNFGTKLVGKTRMKEIEGKLERLKANIVPQSKEEPNMATDGIDISKWEVGADDNDQKVEFSAWDFAGQDVYYATHQLFLSDRAIYIIVFSLLDETFSRVEYWLQSLSARCKSAPILIVGTRQDNPKCTPNYVAKVMTTLKERFESRFKNIEGYYAVSTKTGKGTGKLTQGIVEVALKQPYIPDVVPNAYLALEEKIKLIRERLYSAKRNAAGEIEFSSPPVQNMTDLKEIGIRECGLAADSILSALTFLNDLGTIVYYKDLKHNIVIIDPQWLTKMFATVVTMKQNFIKEGILTQAGMTQIWKEPAYPPPLHSFMIEMLEQFEIVYRLPSDGEMKLFVPCLLRNARNADDSKKNKNWEPLNETSYQQLGRLYRFGFMPNGFFPKLIVRFLHQLTWRPVEYWRNGIILAYEKDTVFMEMIEDVFDLCIYVRGPNREKTMAVLANNVDTLIYDWLQVNVEVYVPCTHCYAEKQTQPFLFPISLCEQSAKENTAILYCNGVTPIQLKELVPDLLIGEMINCKIPYSALKIGNQIGSGGFAKVYKAQWKNETVAVKVINTDAEGLDMTSNLAEFRREATLMSALKHPNLVEMKAVVLDPYCIVMEFMDMGTLYSILKEQKDAKEISWKTKLLISYHIACGMQFLHSFRPPIIHRDLKSPNVFCKSGGPGGIIAKVGDFGLSAQMMLASSLKKKVIDNPIWLAPEILTKNEYTEKADVYAFGVILFEILTQEDYFHEVAFLSAIEKAVIEGKRPALPKCQQPEFPTLITDCWGPDPKKRPPFTAILQSLKKMLDTNGVSYDPAPSGGSGSGIRKTDPLPTPPKRSGSDFTPSQSSPGTTPQKPHFTMPKTPRDTVRLPNNVFTEEIPPTPLPTVPTPSSGPKVALRPVRRPMA